MGHGSLYLGILFSLCGIVVGSSSDCRHKLDVVTVMDGSGSIPSHDFSKMKSAVVQLMNGLNVQRNYQQFGTVVYSSAVSSTIPLSSDRLSLRSRILNLVQPNGGTATSLGIKAMRSLFTRGGRAGARKVGIIITDGRSNSLSDTLREARLARANGVILFAVGVGIDINRVELRGIASSSANVLELANFNQLQQSIKSLITKICKVDGGWSAWSAPSTGSCSATCGGGSRNVTRTRTCTNPRPSNGGKNCVGSSTVTRKEACNTHRCSVDGGWSAWSKATTGRCSATCGKGVHVVTRRRTCTNPRPSGGGKKCVGPSTRVRKEICNAKKCPVNGQWSVWSSGVRGKCSATCGGGTRTVTRKRTCTNPRHSFGGKPCAGSSVNREKEPCNKHRCPIHGGWSSWSSTSSGSCSATCGSGIRAITRTRKCTKPPPKFGGRGCVGLAKETKLLTCNTAKCPVNGGWSEWCDAKKGPCSASCGGGTRTVTRTRTCTNPAPSHGGKKCSGSSTNNYREACNKLMCPWHGGWSDWRVISSSRCSVTCGGGIRTVVSIRTCTNPKPAPGGNSCVGPRHRVYQEACNKDKCPC